MGENYTKGYRPLRQNFRSSFLLVAAISQRKMLSSDIFRSCLTLWLWHLCSWKPKYMLKQACQCIYISLITNILYCLQSYRNAMIQKFIEVIVILYPSSHWFFLSFSDFFRWFSTRVGYCFFVSICFSSRWWHGSVKLDNQWFTNNKTISWTNK